MVIVLPNPTSYKAARNSTAEEQQSGSGDK